jgi:tetratricopeptide (TPR) repeat protein
MKFLITAIFSLCLFSPTAQAQSAPLVRTADYWKPQKFEAYLKQHPADETNREYALKWYGYGNYQGSLDKLKHHTVQMVRYHPNSRSIVLVNGAAFRAHPQFRLETISRLEKKVQQQPKSKVSHELYYNLALLYRQAALPLPTDPASRLRALRYLQMPLDSKLPTSVDLPSAHKAIHSYQDAIESAKGKKFEMAFYSDQLASLYRYLGRHQEALSICEAALPYADAVSKPGLLVTYGRCLRGANRIDEAKSALNKVKEIDYKWYSGHGPGRNTIEAETELGSIALSQGDIPAAGNHLLSSVKAVKDGYADVFTIRTGEGLPIGFRLAERLLAAKQNEVVVEYCTIVLDKFWKHSAETQQLLKKATAAS